MASGRVPKTAITRHFTKTPLHNETYVENPISDSFYPTLSNRPFHNETLVVWRVTMLPSP